MKNKLTSLIIALITFNLAAQNTSTGVGICFVKAPNTPFITGNVSSYYRPNSISHGDFNSDGFQDIALTLSYTSGVYTYLGHGDGTFISHSTLLVNTYSSYSAVADVTGDGKLDIVGTQILSGILYIYKGDGAGNFTKINQYSTGLGAGNFIKIADLNNDGKKDILLCDGQASSYSNLAVFIATGSGNFATPVYYNLGPYCSSVVVADYNNDLKLDIASSNQSDGNIHVFLGVGNGTFTGTSNSLISSNAVANNYGWNIPEVLDGGDVNMDGKMDLVVTNVVPNQISIMLGNGNGTFSHSQDISTQTPVSPKLSDMNLDGKLDLVVADMASNITNVYLGDGNGNFPYLFSYPVSGANGPFATTIADFNNDGLKDIGEVNFSTANTSILLNTLTPTVTVAAMPSAVCAGNPVNLSAIVQGNATYTYGWSDGTANLTTTVIPTVTNSVYTFTVTNNNNQCYSVATISATVNALPAITIAATSYSVCTGNSATLTVGGASSYVWSPSTGLNTVTGTSVIATPTSNTIYTVTGTSTAGCVSSTTVLVTVNPIPTITVNSSTVCAGSPVVLLANGGLTYQWSANAGNATTNTISITSSTTTAYTVTGTDVNGCQSSNTSTVIVNPLPSITVTNPSYCIGGSGLLMATATGVFLYSWSPATNLNHTTGSVLTSATSSTTYTVTGTDGNGCKSTAVSNVTVNPLPVIAVNNPNVCYNTASSLVASGASTYTWSPTTGLNSGYGNSVIANLASNTTYTVSGTNANGCVNKTAITVTVNPLPSAFSVNSATLNCASTTCATLSVNTGGAVINARTALPSLVYSWSPSTGLSASTGTSVVACPPATTVYTITALNSYGCTTSTTATVTVNQFSSAAAQFLIGQTFTTTPTGYFMTYYATANLPSVPGIHSSWYIETLNQEGGPILASLSISYDATNPTPGYSGHPQLTFPGYSYPGTMDPTGITPNPGIFSNNNTGINSSPNYMAVYNRFTRSIWTDACPTPVSYVACYECNRMVNPNTLNSDTSVKENPLTTGIESTISTTENSLASGIESTISTTSGIKIFPNPSSTVINIQAQKNKELGNIIIYNSIGSIVYNQYSKNGIEQINISELPPGMYIVRVQDNITKLVKE